MRIDKKMKRYIEKKGNIIKNYPELCKVLREDEKSGKAKSEQLERWKSYFSYIRDGHKYIIDKIFDDAIIKENERIYIKQKKEKSISIRSKYRKELVEVLKYMIYKSENRELFLPLFSIAIACGFFSKSIKGTALYKDYIGKRDMFKSNNSGMKYYEYDMSYFTYNTYMSQIKNNAYKILKKS